MKILLIGKTGQLGSDILRNGIAVHDIFAPEREILDIGYLESIEKAVMSCKPEIVINTAAFHNVPLCETEYAAAFKINCMAVKELARCSKKIGALFITFSTDYVFDGKKRTPYFEDDEPAPLQIYGISKLAGEYAAMSVWPDKTIIIRTCGLYGISGAKSKSGNFVDKRLLDVETNKYLEISCDQTVCPTYTDDLSKAILQLIGKETIKPGVYHLVNEGECTWYDFTKAIFEIIEFDAEVKPVDRKGLSDDMRRPLYSAMANTKAKALGVVLPYWRNALERYLNIKYLNRW
ncbi:MAG: dTDP-4-dehydrorhamnose reductase [Deltaproteobacteria bacterium]|nr:dTDP-4-dehydrorhamnose reductase [Deltaproteobacteria bacterium]